jgi:SAM-dependent methyltransferase
VDWSNTPHELKADIIAALNKPLPIDNQVADVVVSLSVMEHLCEPQIMLNEAFRILKPNGTMILQVPWQWWIHEAPHDYFRYTPYALKYMFDKAGFTNICIEASSVLFTTWIVKFNYFSLHFIRGSFPLNHLIKFLLVPIWYMGQLMAPYLDKLDKQWELEAQGYYVVAIKPPVN